MIVGNYEIKNAHCAREEEGAVSVFGIQPDREDEAGSFIPDINGRG